MSMGEWAGTLGQAIREHRKTAGLTQAELAQLAGVGKSAVFDIEKGKSTVRLETLLRVLAALNMELHWRSPLAPLKTELHWRGHMSGAHSADSPRDPGEESGHA